MRKAAAAWMLAALAPLGLLSGCATVALVTNGRSPVCRHAFASGLAKVLEDEGETREEARSGRPPGCLGADWRVFIFKLADAVRIRTGGRGGAAS